MLAKRLGIIVFSAAFGAIGFTGCEKKEDAPAEEVEEVKEKVGLAETVKEAVTEKVARPDRAEALGFAKYLPTSTQGFFGFYDGAGFVTELRESKFGVFLEGFLESEGGMSLDDLVQAPEAQMGLSLFREEFFVAVGEGTGKQTLNLLELQNTSNFYQMKALVQLAAAGLSGANFNDDEIVEQAYSGALKDPKILGEVLGSAQMPPVILGCKLSDEQMRLQLSGMIVGGLGEFLAMAGPDGEGVAEAVEIPNGETPLTGVRLVGEKVVANLREEAGEDIASFTDEATKEKILSAMAKKNLVIATGVVGDYLVLFLGSDAAEFQLAESPTQSFAAAKDLSFVDAYLGKKLMWVSSVSQSLVDAVAKGGTYGGLGRMAQGIKAGLSETEAFGDTQDLEVLLDLVGKQEEEMLKLWEYTPAGAVLYREKGYKLEMHGGSNRPDMDLEVEHRMGKLADLDGTLLYMASVGDTDYSEKALEYLDTIGETIYLAAKKVSTLDIQDGDFNEFKQGFGLFDSVLRTDLIQLWKAFREDLHAGLGGEGAVVVDFKGGLPTVPAIPAVLVEQAKVPRIAMVASVKDRAKLGESWKKINGSLESLLKTASQMSGTPIPMQRPLSSEKDDLTTWFFAIPFQTDDCMLTASVDDGFFYTATSKNFTKDLSALLKEGGTKQKGTHVRVDFAELLKYTEETLTLIEKNQEEVFAAADEFAGEEFVKALPQIKEALDALSDLKDLKAHVRKEKGEVRTSVHFNMN